MKKYGLFLALVALIASTLIGSVAFADAPTEGRAGRAELRFLEGMIDHHQMALDMAIDCLEKAQTESVRTLCQNIIDAQSREILTMRGWLLSWYSIDYEPVSMLHADHEQESAASGGMMGMGMPQGGGMMDMMGMMSQMSGMMDSMMQSGQMDMGMMSEMSGMMDMMMGMMQGGGMMGGAQTSAMPAMSMGDTLHTLSILNSLTMGEFLERTADLDSTTPLMDVLNQIIAAGEFQPDFVAMQPMMGSMDHSQVGGMLTEMHNLTVNDMREMVGHLDDGENATMMTLMQHHMEVMAGSASESAAQSEDHAAHHPEGEATEAAPSSEDHSQHQGGAAQSGGEDHSQHQGGGQSQDHSQHQGGVVLTDPAMTMGMFAGLNRLSGVEYEIAWLEAMIDHHSDAIHMAERTLENVPEGVGHDEVRELAGQIISDQSAEIELIEALIAELAG